jgi:hypothetical protein
MGEKMPFTFECRQLDGRAVEVDVSGYLDVESSRRYLIRVGLDLREVARRSGTPIGLLLHDVALSGFDTGSVARVHGEWLNELGDALTAIAVVSKKLTVRFGVAAAKLVVRKPFEIFPDKPSAHEWLATQATLPKTAARRR